MMNLKYDNGEGGRISGVRFCSSLTGCEYVTSTKQALELLKIQNPAIGFTEAAKAGEFDSMTDEAYQDILDTIERVSYLWRYPDEDTSDGKNLKAEMNPLMLLANAIELISSFGSVLQRLKRHYKAEIRLSPERQRELAEQAYRSGLGIRDMENRIRRLVDNALFEHCDTREFEF